ncbi:MAG: hypothetical protein U1C73_09520 [Dietzia sp.]|nr:hypothetical protein [Dietzia sp.]
MTIARAPLARTSATLAAALLALILAACTATETPEPTPSNLQTADVVGFWKSVGNGDVRLELREDGSFRADEFCSFSGLWSQDGERLTLSTTAQTGTPCKAISELHELQEATVNSETLTLFDGNQQVLVELERDTD